MPSPATLQILVAIPVAAAIGALSTRAGLLSPSGGIAAFLLGSIMLGTGGLAGGLPLIAFFLPSSLLSHMGPWSRAKREEFYQKGTRRDAWQVAANGGVAGVLMLTSVLGAGSELYPPLVASLAAAAADTWGTEIGGGLGGRTISIITGRSVAPGTSGGVSLAGTIGGLGGALLVALSALPWFHSPLHDFAIVVEAGLIGTVIDSLIGATLQKKFRCPNCGTITERAFHCNAPTLHHQGLRFVNNDIVNLLCSATAAAAAFMMIAG